jgi:hypothetical protein
MITLVKNLLSLMRLILYAQMTTSKKELRCFWSANELYRLSDRHWSANFSANLCG